ncbi:hypothetical protein [Lacisediminimonas profundi]|uniref:hypothetical protein n=1 Tax=Lacisediminimonas profundi TaxID=2603856 RepID=UPI00124B4051|nr:hypothetical protein [Lacisediminimonas profundi]
MSLLDAGRDVRLTVLSILTLLLGLPLSSCTAPDPKTRVERRYAVHSFGFDATQDSPDIEILDYQYGGTNEHGVRACPIHRSKCTIVPQAVGTYGDMEVGNHLYVKWRIKSTDEIVDDVVDLRRRLPLDMRRQRVYFVVSGKVLSVFLIGPDPLPRNPCPPRTELEKFNRSTQAIDKVFSTYCYRPISTLYPEERVDGQLE